MGLKCRFSYSTITTNKCKTCNRKIYVENVKHILLPWHERDDLMLHTDEVKSIIYGWPLKSFKNTYIISFDIIHHERKSDLLYNKIEN